MKGNIFWWRLEGTGSDGQYVSPIVVMGGGGGRQHYWNMGKAMK